MRVGRLIILALAIPLFITVCRDRSRRATERTSSTPDGGSGAAAAREADSRNAGSGNADVRFRSRDTTQKLGAGDVQITSTDRSIELAVIGDSVVAGFGEKVRGEVRAATDTAAVAGSGFGASIEKMVKRTVAGALDHQLLFPVRSISDVRYQDGKLDFYDASGSKMHLFENTKVDGRKTSMSFERSDAERFIAAFHARKASLK